MRSLPNVFGTKEAVEKVVRAVSDYIRDMRRSAIVVCDLDLEEVYVRPDRLSDRAAVGAADAKGQVRAIEVCLCCGTWFPFDEAAALPCGSTWTNYLDRKAHQEDVAWRHLGSHTYPFYGCPDCGAVFRESGRLHGQGRRTLALLSGVRIASSAEADEQRDREGGSS